jgi:SulP family sulfate permease
LPSQTLLLDLKNVIYIDTSGMDTIMELAHLCEIRNIRLIICGLAHQPLEMAERTNFISLLPTDSFYPDLTSGIEAATA